MPDFDPNVPYNDLPDLPPLESIETTAILKKCISARVSLAELKQAAELIPNSAVLVNALPLLEARASSEIENIVTTTDKLFEFADIAELKQCLAADERQLARNLISQFIVYATGGPVGFGDRDEIEKLLDHTFAEDYGVRSLIHAVVQSEMFRVK